MLNRGRESALEGYFRGGSLALFEETGFGLALLVRIKASNLNRFVREFVVGMSRQRARVTDVLGAGCGANEPFGGRARILHELLHGWQESYRLRVAQTEKLAVRDRKTVHGAVLGNEGRLSDILSEARVHPGDTHGIDHSPWHARRQLAIGLKSTAGRLPTSASPQGRSPSLASRLTVQHVARAMVRICRALDGDASRDIAGVRPTGADHVVRFGDALTDFASKDTTEFANDRSADTVRGGARLLANIYRDDTAAAATGGG